jgi:hypothetical protein
VPAQIGHRHTDGAESSDRQRDNTKCDHVDPT